MNAPIISSPLALFNDDAEQLAREAREEAALDDAWQDFREWCHEARSEAEFDRRSNEYFEDWCCRFARDVARQQGWLA